MLRPDVRQALRLDARLPKDQADDRAADAMHKTEGKPYYECVNRPLSRAITTIGNM